MTGLFLYITTMVCLKMLLEAMSIAYSNLAEPDKLNLSAEKKEKTSVKDKLEAKKKESKTQINHRIRENKRQS